MTRKKGETSPIEGLMADSAMMKPERAVQPMFSFSLLVQMFMLLAAILAARFYLNWLPDRTELGTRTSRLQYEPVKLSGSGLGPFRLAGAWEAESSDPRFGGFSGLEMDRGKLLAVSDSGAVAWLDKPGPEQTSVVMNDLPAGPGDRRYKKFRDAEALRADPAGRGWWVPFERANQLWLYDRSFSRPLIRIRFGRHRWPINSGIEGLVADRARMQLFIEGSKRVFRLEGARLTRKPVAGKQWLFSEAVRLPDGQLLVLERTLGLSGFRNAVIFLDETRDGYRSGTRVDLAVGAFDNMEGLVAERLPDRTTRLWIIADDNFERPMRTLLLALDLPSASDTR